MLLLSIHLQIIGTVLWVFKDYKPEVPSHNSFESQLCGTLKNPHTIRKGVGRGVSGVVVWPLTKSKTSRCAKSYDEIRH